MTTLAREAAHRIVQEIAQSGLAKKLTSETQDQLSAKIAAIIDDQTAETRRELKEFIAWWMRIIHHDHRGTYPEPHWQKCPANVCKSTADSFKDMKAPVEVPA